MKFKNANYLIEDDEMKKILRNFKLISSTLLFNFPDLCCVNFLRVRRIEYL